MKIMKVKKLKIGIQTIMMSGLFIFFIACNNSDTTKSPANTPAGNDTAMNNNPSTDTSATKTTTKTPTKKTRKVRIGSMTSKETAEVKADNTGVYNVADVMPQYPGGQTALEDYMNNNVEYPQAAVDNNSEGT